MKKSILFLFGILFLFVHIKAESESGYDLWLRYKSIEKEQGNYDFIVNTLSDISITFNGKTSTAIVNELHLAASQMIGNEPSFSHSSDTKNNLIITTDPGIDLKDERWIINALPDLGNEGYIIAKSGNHDSQIIIAANRPVGALYGTYHLLRLMNQGDSGKRLPIIEKPLVSHRILNHWDNLDRTIERGYAGFSIWDWHKLPGYIDQRYIDYARANASIGINGTVVTSVNANSLILSRQYLEKVKALADVFRPYGLKIYLTARFSAPIEIGKLKTADPLDKEVIQWWKNKADEIYSYVPDFGGFLVKANSEGQPGPQDYGRSHAEGANMLADALMPHGGIIMWRAFVYSHESHLDRATQAYAEFQPLDGTFRENVIIQVKNGAIDFQPREPFHPLFGAMPQTKLALELQITQEYLGQATTLAYLAPLYKECLDSKTYRPDSGSKVADIIDGSAYNRSISVIAGVSNIGNDINWTGHPFGQANWYAFGRLAWNHQTMPDSIAKEWALLTFGDITSINIITDMMSKSYETVVNYMTPMGLHHIMGRHHHYGPGPWVTGGRADWTSVYYHQADKQGIGFDRTSSGSNAIAQYAEEVADKFADPETCPDKFLLWFHHLLWNYKMKSGKTLWNEICYTYDSGVKGVDELIAEWKELESMIDDQRYSHVSQLLRIQAEEARWWRNSCLLYFQKFSGIPFPRDIEQPTGKLKDYMEMEFPYAPGIRPTW